MRAKEWDLMYQAEINQKAKERLDARIKTLSDLGMTRAAIARRLGLGRDAVCAAVTRMCKEQA